MQLSQSQAEQLLVLTKGLGCQRRQYETGSVLQTPGASPEILLIVSGRCRILDHSRQFGTLTLLRPEAPYLCGAIGLLDPSLEEEITASSACEAVVLGTRPLSSGPLESLLLELLHQRVAPRELPVLQQLASTGSLTIPADQQAPEIFLRRFRVASQADLPETLGSETKLIYADRPDRGFRHGQLITKATLKQFWGDDLPRVLLWGVDQASSIDQAGASEPYALGAQQVIAKSRTDEEPGEQEGTAPVASNTIQLTSRRRAAQLRQLGFQPVSGRTPEKRYEAVLAMLIQHFQVPIRREVLRKASIYLAPIKSEHSIEKLLSVIDQIGLNGRVVIFRAFEANRLPTPAIVLDVEQQPSLIVDANANGVLLIDPAEGVKQIALEELDARLGSQSRALVVSRGSNTQSKRFGFGWMLPYLSQYKIGLVEVFIASFLTQLFALATPLLFQQIIDRVIGQGATSALTGFAVLMAVFMVLELVFSSLRTFQFMEISNRIDINVGSSIISRLLRLNSRYFEKRPVGELSSRLNELEKIRSFLTGTALTVVLDALFSLLYFGVMFFYSPLLSGIILGSIPLQVIVILGLTPLTQKLIRQKAEAYSRTQSYMIEILNGIQTVKVQNSELTAKRNWEDRHLDGINKGYRTVLANTASSNALQLINKTTNILVITVGAWLVLQNDLTLGGLIAFRIISGYVTQPILRLASTWNNLQEVSMSVERLGDVVNQPLETTDLEDTNISMPPIKGKITFDQVSFGYNNIERPQLAGVSLEIPAGSFVGIVGQSGCGKSTLLKLVPRLYEPTRGKVLIDDLDINKVELYSMRRQLGFVPQDCLLFEGSIYSNIAVAEPDAEAEKVVEAATLACAHDFIMGLPYGYSTPIGEKGSGLSGGQRQRIALARMLLQNPGLIVLDEATSALDVDTEQQLVNNIIKHCHGKTILMITHRLSTLSKADLIVMMHEGRIDSVGTHQQLMALSGRYYALYQQQFAA
jgi:ATP-binding cassette subfamily B protein